MPADARLDQAVEVEILGRAAAPALGMLSEHTGVSLGVAPEDLDTVGERKLTIISLGLDLKSIMVQIPEALKECHWDVDDSSEERGYLLHRNAGVDGLQQPSRPGRRGRGTADEIRDIGDGVSGSGPAGGAPGLGGRPPDLEAPRDPALLVEVSLADLSELNLPAVERAIAAQAGLSVISDFFESTSLCAAQAVGRSRLPLWHLLELLAWQNGEELLVWQREGPCLTIYHSKWYWLSQSEMPEEIVRTCRDKLDRQGRLTMHDLAETARALCERDLTDRVFPADLRRVGIGGAVAADAWALILYDSLSPEQRAEAAGEEGLPFADLGENQQAWVLYRARCTPDYLPPGQAGESRLRVEESSRDIRGRPYHEVVVELEFPETADVAVLLVAAGEQTRH
jgi:hypothetical protein